MRRDKERLLTKIEVLLDVLRRLVDTGSTVLVIEHKRALIEPQFEIAELFTKTPRASQGPLRLINARPLRQAMRAIVGESFERMKERLGLGWTLMCLAKKRA